MYTPGHYFDLPEGKTKRIFQSLVLIAPEQCFLKCPWLVIDVAQDLFLNGEDDDLAEALVTMELRDQDAKLVQNPEKVEKVLQKLRTIGVNGLCDVDHVTILATTEDFISAILAYEEYLGVL